MPRPRSVHSTDALLTVLADSRRRAVLRHLSEREGRTSLDAIVDALSTGNVDESDLRVRLHHIHLPRLDDAGLVTYDASARTVDYRPDGRVESLLDCLAEEFDD